MAPHRLAVHCCRIRSHAFFRSLFQVRWDAPLHGRRLSAAVPVRAGNLLGLILSPLLLSALGWRALFLIFGVFGGPLLMLWQLMVPDAPPQQPSAPQQPLQGQESAAGGQHPTHLAPLRSSPSTSELTAVASLEPVAGDAPSGSPAAGGRPGSAARDAADAEAGPAAPLLSVPAASGAAVAVADSALPSLRQRSVGVRLLLGSSAVWAIIVVNVVNHWFPPPPQPGAQLHDRAACLACVCFSI